MSNNNLTVIKKGNTHIKIHDIMAKCTFSKKIYNIILKNYRNKNYKNYKNYKCSKRRY